MNNIYNENVELEQNPLSEIICIDEFKGPAIEGKLIFIIVNPMDNEAIDILPSRKKTYLIEEFDESSIASNPYAAVWFVPPRVPHKSTFFKITYLEEGEAEIANDGAFADAALLKSYYNNLCHNAYAPLYSTTVMIR